MKRQKHFKLKRLILRIVSVLSIISILISSVSISVFANNRRYDSVSLYGYKGDYVMRECGVGTGYISNPPGGTNGSVYSRSSRFSLTGEKFICYMNDIPYGDIDISITANPNGIKFVYVQFQFNDDYNFYSDTNYTVSLPLQLVFYNASYDDNNGIYAKIRQDKLSLIRYDSNKNYYYDVWDITNISVSSNWTFTLNFNFTPTQDFLCNGMLFGFNIDPAGTILGLGEIITSTSYMDALIISPRPTYIFPDFTEQDNANNQEDNLLQNGGSLFGALDTFYSQIGALGSNFSDLLISSKALSVLFDCFIGSCTQLSLLLNFSLVLGLSVFILGVIQTVGSWTFSTVGKYTKGGKK